MVVTRIRLALALVLLAAQLAVAQVAPAPRATANLTTSTCPGSGCLALNVSGYGAGAIQLTGTWTGTNTFESSVDGTNYQSATVTPVGGGAGVTTATANGVWVANVGGIRYLRVRFSTASSGTVVATLQASPSGSGGGGGGGLSGSVQITDGVDTAQVTATAGGSVQVECTSGCGGSGGTSAADGAAFVASTTSGTPAIGARDDAASSTIAEDKLGIVRITTNRAEHVNLRKSDGTEIGVSGAAVIVDGSAVTQPVSAASLPLPTGAATATLQGVTDADDASIATGQTVSLHASETMVYDASVWRRMTFGTAGTASAQVWTVQGVASMTPVQVSQATAGNLNATVVGTGTFATQSAATIADGADVTLGAKADAKSTATDTTAVTLMQVAKEISAMEQAPASRAVTNAGTFATQSTLQTQTDTVMVGGVNVKEINAVTPLMGNGATGTGSQRVTIASDNTAFETIPVATAATTDSVITTNCYLTSAASTNSTNCKSSAGNVYFIHVTNTTTTNYFLRLYNASSAPTCSSSTGFVETIPALGAAANGGVNGRVNVLPQSFTTGIGFCLTGGGSSTDNTNAATGVYVTIGYK